MTPASLVEKKKNKQKELVKYSMRLKQIENKAIDKSPPINFSYIYWECTKDSCIYCKLKNKLHKNKREEGQWQALLRKYKRQCVEDVSIFVEKHMPELHSEWKKLYTKIRRIQLSIQSLNAQILTREGSSCTTDCSMRGENFWTITFGSGDTNL